MTPSLTALSRVASLALGLVLALGCNGGGGGGDTPPPPPAISVSVSGASSLTAGLTATFTATVSNASNPAVTWSVREAGGGTVTSAGLYTAPDVPASATFHVVATSQADSSRSGEAAVTVHPAPRITAFAPASATIYAGRSTTLNATFTGGTGRVFPGDLPITSGTGITVSPTDPITQYDLRVTNALGAVAQWACTVTVLPPPTITLAPEVLPTGWAGRAYALSLSASGGTEPYTFAFTQGSLPPAGLALGADGTLAGTVTTPGTFTFSITARDAEGFTGSRAYTLLLQPAPTLVLTPATLPEGGVGAAYAQTITASGGTAPYTFAPTAGALPTGLTLSPAGLLSGTPTTAGTFAFTLTATDSLGFTGSRAYALVVTVPTILLAPAALPKGTAGMPYAQTITASGGTAPYTFVLTTGTLPAGLALAPNGTLAGTPTAAGTVAFTITATDSLGSTGSQAYIVNFAAPTLTLAPTSLPGGTVQQAYVQAITASGGTAPYTFTRTAGNLPAGLALTASGALSGTPTTTGTSTFTITATDAHGFTGSQSYTVAIAAPTIALAPSSLPNGTIHAAYNQAITASGGTTPYTFAITAGTLPAGLSLAANGALSGTPTATGTSTFTVTATDAQSYMGNRSYSVTITAPTIAVAPTSLPNGTVHTAYSQAITASGGTAPYAFTRTSGNLPAGISLAANGTLSGTPTATGSSTFTITATDAHGFTGNRSYTVTIAAPTITLAPTSLPNGTPGVAYSQAITTSGGTAPYTYATTAGSLPVGLTLSSGGLLSGTPTVAATNTFTVTATDAHGFTGSRGYILTIGSPTTLDLSIAGAYLTQATQTQAFDVPLVKDRNGYLRVFVVANEANTATPQVRARIYTAASVLVATHTIPAPGASVPTSVDESSLTKSWNVAIPAVQIQPGYKLLVDVDPSGAIPETQEANNQWPASGTPHPLDVRTLPNFRVTFWAVQTGDGRVGDVNAGNLSDYTSLLDKIFPLNNATERTFGGVWTTTAPSLSQNTTAGWDTCLSELSAKRVADGATGRYYYGAVNPNYGGGIAGYGQVGGQTAIGWDKSSGYGDSGLRSGVYAHETGHNFGLWHAPCGNPGGVDASYPYAEGFIGAWGLDVAAAALKPPTTYHDIMGYCGTVWISDYNFKKVLANRETGGIPLIQTAPEPASKEARSLLLWGRLHEGEAILEPAFHLATDAMPPESGDSLMEGLDGNGQPLFEVPFRLLETSAATPVPSHHFAFSIPLDPATADRLAEIRWSKGGKLLASRRTGASRERRRLQESFALDMQATFDGRSRLSWDRQAYPVVMIRDAATGLVLGFARNGDFTFTGRGPEVELIFSDGVRSHRTTRSCPTLGE